MARSWHLGWSRMMLRLNPAAELSSATNAIGASCASHHQSYQSNLRDCRQRCLLEYESLAFLVRLSCPFDRRSHRQCWAVLRHTMVALRPLPRRTPCTGLALTLFIIRCRTSVPHQIERPLRHRRSWLRSSVVPLSDGTLRDIRLQRRHPPAPHLRQSIMRHRPHRAPLVLQPPRIFLVRQLHRHGCTVGPTVEETAFVREKITTSNVCPQWSKPVTALLLQDLRLPLCERPNSTITIIIASTVLPARPLRVCVTVCHP